MLLVSWLATVVARVRSMVAGVLGRAHVERQMDEEFRHHISMRAEDLVRRGVPAAEASRQAHLEFGHAERHKEAGRAARGDVRASSAVTAPGSGSSGVAK